MAGRSNGEGSGRDAPKAPGWYPDPWSADGTGERYFDGKVWQAQTPKVVPRERKRRRRPRSSGGRRGSRVGPTVVVLVVLAVVGYAWWQQRSDQAEVRAQQRRMREYDPSLYTTHPPAGVGSKPERLLPTPVAAVPSTSYLVSAHQKPPDQADAVTWDPCRPIRYVTYLGSSAPPDAMQLLHDAVDRVSKATGLQFVDAGLTSEPPSIERLQYQPQRYDRERWAPVLIAWSTAAAYQPLADLVEGETRQAAWTFGTSIRYTEVYVSGQVVLDAEQMSVRNETNRSAVRAVIMHELGHLVGLDHTNDATQLMYTYTDSVATVGEFGAGDLAGLALVGGTKRCFPQV